MTREFTHIKPSHGRPHRFQFALSTLFLVTTIVAVLCALVFRVPVKVGMPAVMCLLVSTPVVLTVVLIYGRAYARTFSVGAMFPAGLMFLSLLLSAHGFDVVLVDTIEEFIGPVRPGPNYARIYPFVLMATYSALLVGNGLLAVLVRRLVEPREPVAGKRAPEESMGTTRDESETVAGKSGLNLDS